MKKTGLLFGIFLLFSSGFGQSLLDDNLSKLSLGTIDGKIKTRYGQGYELRAKTLQTLLEKCCTYYEEKSSKVQFTVELLVLGEQDWNTLGTGIPYGLPTSLNSENKILIAGDKNYVGSLFGKPDTLPDDILSEFDYIVLHELGHNYIEYLYEINVGYHWATEFIASYFAICYLEDTKSEMGLPELGSTGYIPQYRSLDDFERLYAGVGPQNYGWYQEKFIELGKQLYPTFKLKLIDKFINNFSHQGKRTEPEKFFKKLSPKITQSWLQQMQ